MVNLKYNKQAQPIERLLYSMPEGAEMLGISKATFLQYVYAGIIPTRYLGGRRLCTRKDLETFVDGLPGSSPKKKRKT